MKLSDILLRGFVWAVFATIGILVGLTVIELANGQEIPEVEAGGVVIFGPESFESYDAWFQHLEVADQGEVITTLPRLPKTPPSPPLMDPYFAKKYLRGDAWAAWALKYNERARNAAREDTTTQIESSNGDSVTITTTPHKTYTARPLTIYNPFCPPLD